MADAQGMVVGLSEAQERARDAGVRLVAELKPTDRNRMMLVTYRFAGFKEVERRGEVIVFDNDFSNVQPFPGYVDVRVRE